ncbi:MULTISPECIES: hypothetical protein [unclassified Paraburkholderia]|uniref:hypothetical protein n=1 Tax=unclassified Paraburkholderia TaxID=2615204 RepID=UPI002AB034B9|nr:MULTISPECIES: hypothetical protein [unclassified Paraburkholderia]
MRDGPIGMQRHEAACPRYAICGGHAMTNQTPIEIVRQNERKPGMEEDLELPKTGRTAIWLGLAGVPGIWLAHLALCVTLISNACDDFQHSGALPWPLVERIVAGASAVSMIAAVIIAIAASRAWRMIASQVPGKRNPARFIAWCGATAAVAFTVGLAFSSCLLIVVPIDRLCATFH